MFSCAHMKAGYLAIPCMKDSFCVSRGMRTEIAQIQCAGLEFVRPPPNIPLSR